MSEHAENGGASRERRAGPRQLRSSNPYKMVIDPISLNPSSIARVLGAMAFLLVLASIGSQLMAYLTGHSHIYGLVPLFYLDVEKNLPTGFSTLLLLFAALLLGVIAVLQRKQTDSPVLYWALLSIGCLFMAVDEAWSFHEMLIKPIRKLLGDDNLGVFYYAWVIPGIVLILVLAPFFLRFLLRLPAKTRLTFLMAAILYIGGAIGGELIGGYIDELHGKRNLPYIMIVTVEEGLEMAGVIVLIKALLVYIADNYKEVRFHFDGVHEKVTIDAPLLSQEYEMMIHPTQAADRAPSILLENFPAQKSRKAG
jgi:hypothetical protein